MDDRRDLVVGGELAASDQRGAGQPGTAAAGAQLSVVWASDARTGEAKYAGTCALLAGVAAFKEGHGRGACLFCGQTESALVEAWLEGWDIADREAGRVAGVQKKQEAQVPQYWWSKM